MSMEHDDDIAPDWTQRELSVLRSAELDGPPRGADERTLAALGLGAAVGAGAGFGGASALAKAAPAETLARSTLWLKWLGAALIGGAAASALIVTRKPPRHAVPSAIARPAAAASSSPGALAPPAAEPAQPSPEPVADVSAVAPPPVAQPAPSVDAKLSLADEIRMIDEARSRLRSGNAAGSLETLARYDQMVKRGGSMRAEATVVRIEALQASGAGDKAQALGARFLAKNPGSPYADYVRHILAGAR